MTALDAATDEDPGDRAAALLLAAWIEASSDNVAKALGHVTEAAELAAATRGRRPPGTLRLLPRVRGIPRRRLPAGAGAHRAQPTLYEGLDRPWDQAANALFEARAAISAGDVERSLEARDQVTPG